MNKKDYLKYQEFQKKMIEYHTSAMKESTKIFQKECPHPKKSLMISDNYHEDDYGKRIEEWTTYNYECERCGIKLSKVKQKFKDANSLREALKEESK